MALRLPPLTPLRLFEAAGRLDSFKLAAEELHLTPSAVSHGITTLERWLGIELFDRGPRGISLNADGRDYLHFVGEALALIATGTQRLPRRAGARTVTVSVAPTFASRILLPSLHRFQDRHPDISVSIDTARRHVAFPADAVDLAVRMGRGPWPGLSATRLVAEQLVPVCAPAYLAALRDRTGRIALGKAVLLHVDTATEDWGTWLGQATDLVDGEIDLRRGLHFDTAQLALDAAAAGLGIAVGRKPIIRRELLAGVLVEAFDRVVATEGAYWLVGAQTVEQRREVAAFKRWLVAEIASI